MNRATSLVTGRLPVAFALAFALAVPTVASSTCGGKERWFVKVGTDPAASQVDTAHPTQSTVAALNAMPQLRDRVPAGDDRLRLSEETKVYVVHGYLALFKNEADSDYHLVITDSTLNYTPGGPSSAGKETGTSFIAEIPDPNCVAGTQGNPAVPSAFAAALASTRSKFEAEFPNGKGADAFQGLPVTVTGVAFYDRLHNQLGRAVNGIELHPLLDISFGAEPQPQPTPVASELLTNPGFELGSAGWTGSTSAIGEYVRQAAHGGKQICWLGGYGCKKTESVSQKVTIPASVRSAALSLWVRVETEETTTTTPYDVCRVQVKSASGSILKTLVVLSNLNETAGYLQKSYDMTEFKGQTIRVSFKAEEDAGKQTSFILDDVSLATR